MTTSRTAALIDALTITQYLDAAALYEAHGSDAVARIQAQVIEPNLAAINALLGQESEPRHLAHAVVQELSALFAVPCRCCNYHIRVTLHGEGALIQLDGTQPRGWGWAIDGKAATRFSPEEAKAWIEQHRESEISRHALVEVVLAFERTS